MAGNINKIYFGSNLSHMIHRVSSFGMLLHRQRHEEDYSVSRCDCVSIKWALKSDDTDLICFRYDWQMWYYKGGVQFREVRHGG